MARIKVMTVVVVLLCASTASAKTHAGVVKGQVRGALGPFDAIRTFEFGYRLSQQNHLAVVEYRFRYGERANPRFLGKQFGARTIPFKEVRVTTPKWVVAEARVRFFGANHKQDGSAKIYLFADDLRPAGQWSDPNGPKRVVPWRLLFHKVKSNRSVPGALPSDADYKSRLYRELLASSTRIVIDRPRIVHVHYGANVWRAFAQAYWRGYERRLAKLPANAFWDADPVATPPSREPQTRAYKAAAAIYGTGIPFRGTASLNVHNALVVTSPYNGQTVRRTKVTLTGRVQHIWRRLARDVRIDVNGRSYQVAISKNGTFTQVIDVRQGRNNILVELEGPAQKVSRSIYVNQYPRPRRVLYWVCMQTLAERSVPYNQRHTKTFLSRVFTTNYSSTSIRYQVQKAWQKFVLAQYGKDPNWRAYGTSCTPYSQQGYAHRRYNSYQRYVYPPSNDRQRYRRLPGAVLNFQFKEP